MESVLKILMVEDLPSDTELIIREIKKSGIQFISHIVDNKEDYIKSLLDYSPDLILSDYSLPVFDGMQALLLRKELAPLVPFILVTGSMNEETAVEVMKAGADYYVIKEHLTRIGTAIKTVLEKQEIIRMRMKAEEKLVWEQYLFMTLIENVPDKIYFKDLESRFIRVNKAMAGLLKLNDPLRALGKSDNDFYNPVHSREARLDEQNIIETGIPVIGKEEMESSADGIPIWVSTTKMPLKDPMGNIIGTFGISRDISVFKHAEDELRKAKDKAEESDRLKTAFLHNISHEIRTPMNAIVGFSGFLSDPKLSPIRRKHFIDIIVQSSNQLLSIITDIVSLATIEAGQEEINENVVNVNDLCKLLQEQFKIEAENKHLFLRHQTQLDDKEADIITDDIKITQVLSNLIGNAVKFTPHGHIEFGYTVKANELEFYIEDTGIGIAEEMFDIIFERFRQVDYDATRKFGGSGLGLSISKAYVELLGGKIWLKSVPGKGSVFYFTLPFKRAISEKLHGIGYEENIVVPKGKTILIAEDDNSNFMVLEEYLSGSGVTILRARDGNEAVQICKSMNVDLLLMDIKMPNKDGYEATGEIKKLFPGLPVIAQTAYSLHSEKEKAFQAGCDDFITKPIKETDLKRVMLKYLK
jgi:PAS domain S-box-containing protein